MENKKTLLESCSELTMEELEKLSLTKILGGQEEETQFIGLGILGEDGYLLEYDQIKKINSGLGYFLRNVNPELIREMNLKKQREDQIQRDKDELIQIISKNIIDKEDMENEFEDEGFFNRIKRLFKRKEY